MLLTTIWLLPTLGAVLVALLPRGAARAVALAISLVTLGLAAYLAAVFDPGHQGYQLSQQVGWIPQLHATYHLGVDGISLWLIVLNSLLTVIALAATPASTPRLGAFLSLMLLLEASMAGLFMAVDLLLFYIFWEAMLIPAYFLLWQWGEGDRPGRAALKFVLYTLAGSLLMLVGILGEYAFSPAASFDLPQLAAHPPPGNLQFGLFFLFAIAFAIKIPVFPFHAWLPDAYMAAPTPFLVTFAGVMGKTGAYGFLRVLLPLLRNPSGWWDWHWVLAVLAVGGIAWGAFLALAQRDMKGLVAYSSISHMGFIVLGIFALNTLGQQGAVLQMVNHGLIVPALFLLVAWIAARTGTRDRSALSGLAPATPVLTAVFLIVTLAALGLPGLNSFAGEFMTLFGAWGLSPWLAVAGCIGLILAPVYMLRLFQGAMYGPRSQTSIADIAGFELAQITPLLLLMFVLGFFPYLLTRAMAALGQGMPPWQ
jgi:NADH-quinone oxidoreductase subunit M